MLTTYPSILTAIVLNFMLLIYPTQSSSSPPPKPLDVACTKSADDAEIYSLVIHETLLKSDQQDAQIVLFDQTSAGYPPGMAATTSFGGRTGKELLDSADTETKKDFDARTKVHCDVEKSIEPHERIHFVTASEAEALLRDGRGGWDAFHKQYPHASGFTLVSAIGFNTSHDQALVYLGHSCGSLCGSGYFVLLAKKGGKWQVENSANIWVS